MELTDFYHWVFGGVWALHYCFVMLVAGVPPVAIVERLLKGREGGRAWAFLRGPYPICISLAITTGVAPLLFGQVLFHRVFYQALVVMYPLPLIGLGMLIVFFYVSYLVKHVERWALPLAFAQVGFVVCFMLFFGMLFNGIATGSSGLRELWFAGDGPPLLWHSLGAHLAVSAVLAGVVVVAMARRPWWQRGVLLLAVGAGVSAAREILRLHFGGEGVIPAPLTTRIDVSAWIFVVCLVVAIVVLYRSVRLAFGRTNAAATEKRL